MNPMRLPTHITVDRRKFLLGASALIAAGLLPREVLALAGPHTFTHGDVTVMVLSDGSLTLPTSILAPTPRRKSARRCSPPSASPAIR